jgi:hypothetical protein
MVTRTKRGWTKHHLIHARHMTADSDSNKLFMYSTCAVACLLYIDVVCTYVVTI